MSKSSPFLPMLCLGRALEAPIIPSSWKADWRRGMRSHLLRLAVECIQQLVSIYLAGNRSFLSKTSTATVQHGWLVAPQERGFLHWAEAVLGELG